MTVYEFAARLQPAVDDQGGVSARIVPFGYSVPYGDGQVRFERGGLEMPGNVPLTIDHGDSVLDRVGILAQFLESDDGAYATFEFADTARAQDVRSLLRAGAVQDVSIGVAEFTVTDGVMSGTLDHVSIVPHGRFGKADAPSRVLAVHSTERGEAVEGDATMEAAAPQVAYDDTEIRETVSTLETRMVELADVVASVEKPAAPIDAKKIMTAAIEGAMKRRADFALADVVGDLGTADASGLNPDFYWSAGLQQEARQWRPTFDMAGTGPFPAYGLNLTSAKVTQNVAVGSGKVQKAETASQALQVGAVTWPVVFHSGAVDVAYELIEQSDPGVLEVLRRSFLKIYAGQTNLDAVTKANAGATATGAALRTDTYVNLITDLRTTGVLIREATGSFGNMVGVTSAEFTAILTLVDAEGRRYLSVSGPNNADGAASLVAESVNIAGFTIYEDPDLSNAIQFNTESLITHEKAPEFIRAVNVPNIGLDMGIVGATVVSFWNEGLYKYTV